MAQEMRQVVRSPGTKVACTSDMSRLSKHTVVTCGNLAIECGNSATSDAQHIVTHQISGDSQLLAETAAVPWGDAQHGALGGTGYPPGFPAGCSYERPQGSTVEENHAGLDIISVKMELFHDIVYMVYMV